MPSPSTASDPNVILRRFQRFGVHLGLDRTHQLLAALDNPHHRVPIVHVAGTNGKGSVCAYLSSVLTQAGYRVGRYTSPHLVDWCERICVNGQPIPVDELKTRLLKIEAVIKDSFSADQSPTQFEVITAAAWLYFAHQRVDLAVMEVGLGGRLDATNVCDRPLVSVITSISRDHWQRLGPTLADIAGEKAGILKPNCPAVIAPLPPEAQAVVKARVAQLHCPTVWPQPATNLGDTQARYHPVTLPPLPQAPAAARPPSPSPSLSSPPRPSPLTYTLPLPGAHQRINSAIAIATLQVLQQQGWTISEEAISHGISQTQWSGRLQWVTLQGRKLLLDGAHNEASAEVLGQYVNTLRPNAPKSRVTWIMGMLTTKAHADIFKALLQADDYLHLVPVPGHQSASTEELATLASTLIPNIGSCYLHPDVSTALSTVLKPQTHHQSSDSISDDLVVLCGSLYLVGSFLAENPQPGND